ncbi:MAG: SGNH/GDSL hydrolase family protein [Verrucomicrobium sp.]
MKTILCYGDSNTWGYDPVATATSPFARRHAPDVRWTGVLAKELGGDYRVVEEGQNGRTTVHDDPIMGNRNGRDYLPACLESHKPIDLVVLMLGSNDLKMMFNLPSGEIAAGAGQLVKMIRQSDSGVEAAAPQVLLLCPPPVGDMSHLPDLDEKFSGVQAKAKRFPEHYASIAKPHGCAYLNTQTVVTPSTVDALHLEAEEHAKLGKAVAHKVKAIFGD